MSAPARRRGGVFRLVARLHRWAESGWAGPAAGTWGVMQGSVVPGPLEALLLPLGLADPPRAFHLGAWSAAGSTIGAALGYAVGAFFFGTLGGLLPYVGIDPASVEGLRDRFTDGGTLFLLAAGTLPLIPGKLVWIAAGIAGYPFIPFIAAAGVARTLRFAASAALIHFGGERMIARLERRYGKMW